MRTSLPALRPAAIFSLVLLFANSAVASDVSQDTSGGATLTGKAIFQGEKPQRTAINMATDPNCASHRGKLLSETALVNDSGMLQNVMVYIKSGLEGKEFKSPTEPMILDQAGCMYRPHVFGIMVGQPLKVRDSDATIHNVHSHSQINNPFNFAESKKGDEKSVVLKEPEAAITIQCDIHTWMIAYCWVFEHPFFAVTGEDGSFVLPNLPPGDYTVEAWHEKYGTRTLKITLAKDERKEIQFKFE